MHYGSNGTDRNPPSGTESFPSPSNTKKQFSHKIVQANISDSTEEWVLNVMVNNTLEQFWDWKRTTGIEDLHFEIVTPWVPHDYSQQLEVLACTNDSAVAAMLAMQFPVPLKKLGNLA